MFGTGIYSRLLLKALFFNLEGPDSIFCCQGGNLKSRVIT